MKIKTAIVLSTALLACGTGWAAAGCAPHLHATKTISINAPAGQGVETVKNFNALNSWHPAVEKDEIVEGKNNTVGAVRLLTLKDGGTSRKNCCPTRRQPLVPPTPLSRAYCR